MQNNGNIQRTYEDIREKSQGAYEAYIQKTFEENMKRWHDALATLETIPERIQESEKAPPKAWARLLTCDAENGKRLQDACATLEADLNV